MSFLSIGLIRFLVRHARAVKHIRLLMTLIIVAGVIGGISNAVLLAMINKLLSGSSVTASFMLTFAALCIVLPVSRFLSEAILLTISAKAMLELRYQLSRRILAAPLRRLEELGPHRLLASLAEDVPTIGNTMGHIPILSLHFSIVAGCLIYLGWLSWKVLLGVLAFMMIGFLTYKVPLKIGARAYAAARDEWDRLFGHFEAVTNGVKELKLHRARRESFLSEALYRTADSLRRHGMIGHMMFAGASCWGQGLFFILIGLILYFAPGLPGVTGQTLIGYSLIILYMMTPLQMIFTLLPSFANASVAMRKIDNLNLPLEEENNNHTSQPTVRASGELLRLSGVTHSYGRDNGTNGFVLGPVNLEIKGGELLFITGGNGSGKTTLAKLLLGLYVPDQGEIYLNGELVTNEKREQYRQHFSAVFSDFYLFRTLFGLNSGHLDHTAQDYLARLQLDHKVKVEGGELSTLELSQGQRKRLALLTAYLEDRPIYLFDEWAADQDPIFKEIFYYQLLPELKSKGKAVVIISHDDRYYSVADRVVKLDYGKVQPEIKTTAAT